MNQLEMKTNKNKKLKSVAKKLATTPKARALKAVGKKLVAKKSKGAAALKLLGEQFPDKLKAVQKLKAQGNQIMQEARELVSDVSSSVPEAALSTLKNTQAKVSAKLKSNPKLASAAAAVVGVGAALVTKRLISGKKT